MNVSRKLVILAGCLVFILVCIMVILVILEPHPSPGNTPDPVSPASTPGTADLSPDGTNCLNRENLEQANRDFFATPTVVDINDNGNILVRGPMPLIIRDGPGNSSATSPCLNQSEWRFSYTELNGFIRNGSSPAYFNDSEREHLTAALRTFNLADYQLIDVSLLYDQKNHEETFKTSEKQAFGGNFSTCSGPMQAGMINGQTGYLIESPVGTASTCVDSKCENDFLNNNTFFILTGQSCGLVNLVKQIDNLVKEKDPSGKKRLIYYHCLLGRDRTGTVTASYLLEQYPNMSYCQALKYTEYLGQTSPPRQYFNGVTVPLPESQSTALAYCMAINGRNCSACPAQ